MQGKIATPVIAVDCEGFSRSENSIAMIQVAFQDHSYLFDLKLIDPFDPSLEHNLTKVLESPKVIKIFHDFCEDSSALYNFHNIACQKVFDSQIAHRIFQDATMGSVLACQTQKNYRQISLNDLLFYYLGAQTQNTQKEKIAQ